MSEVKSLVEKNGPTDFYSTPNKKTCFEIMYTGRDKKRPHLYKIIVRGNKIYFIDEVATMWISIEKYKHLNK
jgi:hypothetical protein